MIGIHNSISFSLPSADPGFLIGERERERERSDVGLGMFSGV